MAEHLKPWYAVATPHKDIREGRLEEAVFATAVDDIKHRLSLVIDQTVIFKRPGQQGQVPVAVPLCLSRPVVSG